MLPSMGTFAKFRSTETDTRHLSELEEQVIRLLPSQTEVLQEKLAYHWQNFKVTESAVPLAFLASDAMLHGTRTQYDTNALWANIQAVTAQKRQFWVQRRIDIFLKNLQGAAHSITISTIKESRKLEATIFNLIFLRRATSFKFLRKMPTRRWAQNCR